MKNIWLASLIIATVVSFAELASAQESAPPYMPYATPRFTVTHHPGPAISTEDALSQSLAGTTVPIWNGSFTSNSTNYPFVMVGTDPTQGSATTTVPAVIIPLIFRFHNGGLHSLGPGGDVCGVAHSAINLTLNSPVFMSFPFTAGSTALGTTQYADAFQRANFWDSVSTTSPDYHVLLSKPFKNTAVIVNVPLAEGNWMPLNGSKCPRIGMVEINWFDNTIIPGLLTKLSKAVPTSFPIFLTYNVFFYDPSPSYCCILGYHSDIYNTKGLQTYAVAAFSDPGIFVNSFDQPVPIEDIDALSHEVGEWMDDPLGNTAPNITPTWGNVGQVSGCPTPGVLEVGDALTGTAITVMNPVNHYTYHPQDLTFLPWFAQGSTSSSVNGWWDFNNVFGSSSAPCPPGGLSP